MSKCLSMQDTTPVTHYRNNLTQVQLSKQYYRYAENNICGWNVTFRVLLHDSKSDMSLKSSASVGVHSESYMLGTFSFYNHRQGLWECCKFLHFIRLSISLASGLLWMATIFHYGICQLGRNIYTMYSTCTVMAAYKSHVQERCP